MLIEVSRDSSMLTAEEKTFMRRTSGYTRLYRKKNEEILEQMKTESMQSYIQLQRQNRLNHINRMERTRIQ